MSHNFLTAHLWTNIFCAVYFLIGFCLWYGAFVWEERGRNRDIAYQTLVPFVLFWPIIFALAVGPE